MTPTDQMAVPGHAAGTEITPRGWLYTGNAELAFRLGPRLRDFDQRIRTLADGRLPVFTSSVRHGRVRYTVTTFAAAVHGRPVNFVRVEMRNVTRRSATGRWSTGVRRKPPSLRRFPRPATPARAGLYHQPGSRPQPRAKLDFRGRALTRGGRVLYIAPDPPRGVRRALRVRDRRGVGGRSVYSARLSPGERVALDFRMPVVPVPKPSRTYRRIAAAPFDLHRDRTLRYWRRLLDGAMEIELPESKVEDAFYASLANMAMARYKDARGRWVQTVNKLQYHAFYLRDGAVITNAFDLVGLHHLAERNLGFFLSWQDDSGNFISRPGQRDGFGQALWALGEHVLRSGDLRLARRWFPRVERAVRWFARARRRDPLGIMPRGNPRDNELVGGHLAGDNFWAAAGLERAVLLARAAGEERTADRWAAMLAEYRAVLDRRVRRAARRGGGWIPPTLDGKGGQDWGNLWAAYPVETYDADSRIVSRTIRHVRAEFREGLATWKGLLHGYLGFRVLQTELRRDEQHDVVAGLYAALAHTTSTHGGFETNVRPYGDRSVAINLTPHGWWAAEYVALLRNMLVREEGRGLVLMSALSPAWLAPGERVAVSGAPTTRGRVSFDLVSREGGATLRWDADVPEGTPLHWPVPGPARDVRAPGLSGRTIELPGRSGEINVHWRLPDDAPTYRSAVKRLLRNYASR
ncbi:MAG: hypothetical protein WD844_05450 [Thermoleophilaceae bacterium]